MIKHTSLWYLALGIFLIALFLASPPVAHAQDTGRPKLDIVVIVDESGSMWFETDVKRDRIHAFNLLIDTLGAEAAIGNEVRVSVIAFGSAELTQIVLDFTPVNAGTVKFIKDAYQSFNDRLADPPYGEVVGLEWTDARKALELAGKVLEGHLPEHKPAIIILSDGKPETETVNEAASNFEQDITGYIQQIYAQAARFQSPPGGPFYYEGVCPPIKQGWVPIYTIGIREGAALPEIYDDIWRSLAEQNGGRYYADPRDQLSLGSLGSQYYEIWTDLVCQRGELIPAPVNDILEHTYEVFSHHTHTIVTILKDNPDIGVTIYRPDGSLMPEDHSSLTLNRSPKSEVWTIERSEPWVGTWTVVMMGTGTVWVNYKPVEGNFQVKRIHPPSNFVTACTPIDMVLKIVDGKGASIAERVQNFQVKVKTPEGAEKSLGNVHPEQDVFRLHYPDTCDPGAYKFSVIFQILEPDASGVFREQSWSDEIDAILNSYLEVVSPLLGESYSNDQDVPLQVDIKVGRDPDPATATTSPPVIANVHQQDNASQILGSYELTYDSSLGQSRMKGSIPGGALGVGSYVVEFSLKLADGTTLAAQSEFSITSPEIAAVTSSPTASPDTPGATSSSSLWIVAGVLGGLVLVAATAGAVWWYRQLPSMLRFTLYDNASGTLQTVGTKLGGKFSQTMSFVTAGGESVKLRFSPGSPLDGLPTTQVTLLNDLGQDTRVVMDHTYYLSQKGDSANITNESDSLTINNGRHDISPL